MKNCKMYYTKTMGKYCVNCKKNIASESSSDRRAK